MDLLRPDRSYGWQADLQASKLRKLQTLNQAKVRYQQLKNLHRVREE